MGLCNRKSYLSKIHHIITFNVHKGDLIYVSLKYVQRALLILAEVQTDRRQIANWELGCFVRNCMQRIWFHN
jgi:hypothetical protein